MSYSIKYENKVLAKAPDDETLKETLITLEKNGYQLWETVVTEEK